MRTRASVLAMALFALATFRADAAPPDDITIDDLKLGTYWYGPKVSKKDLLGKVVLVEIYGS